MIRWRRAVRLSVAVALVSASGACAPNSSASPHPTPASTVPTMSVSDSISASTESSDGAAPRSRPRSPAPAPEIARAVSREVVWSLPITDPSPVLRPVGRIDRVVVIGDSLFADGRSRPGGRVNLVVERLTEIVHATPGLGDVVIENAAIPGLATKYGIGLGANESRDTLVEYLPEWLDKGLDASDVVIIALSGIDLQVLADVPVPTVADDLLRELEDLLGQLSATGAQVALVPVFGVNEAMHGELLAPLGDDAQVGRMSDRITEFNAAVRAAGLPLLIDGVRSLDPDRDGEIGRTFFVGYDDRVDGWPDDGIHPNHLGEILYASELGAALAFNLRWAIDPASWPEPNEAAAHNDIDPGRSPGRS